MPRPKGTVRKQCIIYLIIDGSGSMKGSKIEQVNYAIPNILDNIEKLNNENLNSEVKVAIMRFANDVTWVTPKPVTPEEMRKQWKPIEAKGRTILSTALLELDSKMDYEENGGFHDNVAGVVRPGIIFVTDGCPENYNNALQQIQNNPWWDKAFRFCLACGDEFAERSETVFDELTGGRDFVRAITKENSKYLKDYITIVTTVISTTVSTRRRRLQQLENNNSDDTNIEKTLVKPYSEYDNERLSDANAIKSELESFEKINSITRRKP